MKREEVIESFYFSKTNQEDLDKLFADFPQCFSQEKLTPLNFQLHMTDAGNIDKSSRNDIEKRDKLSVQSAVTKLDLKRTLLSDILTNKGNYTIFNTLSTAEERSER